VCSLDDIPAHCQGMLGWSEAVCDVMSSDTLDPLLIQERSRFLVKVVKASIPSLLRAQPYVGKSMRIERIHKDLAIIIGHVGSSTLLFLSPRGVHREKTSGITVYLFEKFTP